MISVENITKTLGLKTLFNGISFGASSEDKIALIGANGTGKSTLLRIIAGYETYDGGKVVKNRETKINFLEQTPKFDPEDSILEHIFKSDDKIVKLIKRYEELRSRMGSKISPSDENELGEVITAIDKENGWEYEQNIRSILSELEINDLTLQMKALSGGMFKKVALSQALIGDSNLLLLDEPTNHLDLKTIQFLEDYLIKSKKAFIMVTHDRYFLDRVCSSIVEIDRSNLYKYDGKYAYYLEKKAEFENIILKEEDKINNILRKELEWYKRQPKARTTKSKSRMDSIEGLMKREKNQKGDELEFTIEGRRLGKKILELNDIEKSFGGKIVIKPFSYVFRQNERIGIIGPNGSGKTTFLNLITGALSPDKGTIDKGVRTEFGYFTQNSVELDPDMKVIDYIKKFGEVVTLSDGATISASKALEKFLFPASVQYGAISKLSGGEKRRLSLVGVLMKNPNFLILDEPTNDFDLNTLTILEDFLSDFNGCIIVVTHDRYLMNRVVDRLLVFDQNGSISSFPGNYSDYLEYIQSQTNAVNETEVKIEKKKDLTESKNENAKKKMSFKEKKELEGIVIEIESLENEKKLIEDKFSSPSFDSEIIKKLNERYLQIENTINEKYERWEYLTTLL